MYLCSNTVELRANLLFDKLECEWLLLIHVMCLESAYKFKFVFFVHKKVRAKIESRAFCNPNCK